MPLLLMAGCKDKVEEATAEGPLKIVCKNDKNQIVLSATVKEAKKMATRKGYIVTDMNDKQMNVRGECEVSSN